METQMQEKEFEGWNRRLHRELENFAYNEFDVLTVDIIGKSGTGKSNTADYAVQCLLEFERFLDCEFRYMRAPAIENAISCLLTPTEKKSLVIEMDDASFLYRGKGGVIDLFQNLLTQVRHIAAADRIKVATFFVTHYEKSITPFLRNCDMVILTWANGDDVTRLSDQGYFPKADLRRFHGMCRDMWNVRDTKGFFDYIDGRAFHPSKWRPILFKSIEVCFDRIPKIIWPKESWNPLPLDEALDRMEEKCGRNVREDVQLKIDAALMRYEKKYKCPSCGEEFRA